MSIQIYLFTCLKTNKKSIIKTTFLISNYISSKKKSVKDTSIKSILITNNYIYKLIQTIPKDTSKDEIQKIMYEIQNNLLIQDKKDQIDNEYKKRYEKGKDCELTSKEFIEQKFNLTLTPSKYKFSHYDFADIRKGILIELKSLKQKYSQYTFIGVDKAISQDILLIFYFENEKQYYYIRYDKIKFDNYETQFIKPKERMYYNEVFKIPTNELILLDDSFNDTITSLEQISHFNKIILQDDIDAKMYERYIV